MKFIDKNNPVSEIIIPLFGFFMKCVLGAIFTVLFDLQAILEGFFILTGKIVHAFALGTLHFDHVVLGHRTLYILNSARPF
jgi:hypothetical protein